ncbi:uncharacterized protein TM35_000731100, partial [Trypanosoma theileri]
MMSIRHVLCVMSITLCCVCSFVLADTNTEDTILKVNVEGGPRAIEEATPVGGVTLSKGEPAPSGGKEGVETEMEQGAAGPQELSESQRPPERSPTSPSAPGASVGPA